MECTSYQQVVYVEETGAYECNDCDPYMFPNAIGRQCQDHTCLSAYEILNEVGDCVQCPDMIDGTVCENNYCFPDETGRACELLDCPEFSFLNTQGQCADCALEETQKCYENECESDYQQITDYSSGILMCNEEDM